MRLRYFFCLELNVTIFENHKISAFFKPKVIFSIFQSFHRRCLDDRLAAFHILCGNSKLDEAEELTTIDEEDPLTLNILIQLNRFRKPIMEPQCENTDKKFVHNQAFSIPILKSRNIYGVADVSGKLGKNECFIQVTEFNSEVVDTNYRRIRQSIKTPKIQKFEDGTKMVVMKSPTYFPGDIRILKQKNIKELEHLVDVIVFPVNDLDRPHTHEIHER